jgi:hypothetical protein
MPRPPLTTTAAAHLLRHRLHALPDPGPAGAGIDRGRHLLHLGLTADVHRLDRLRLEEHDGRRLPGPHASDPGAAEVGNLDQVAIARRIHVLGVGDHADAEPGCQPSRHLAGIVGETEEQEPGLVLPDQGGQGVGGRLAHVVGVDGFLVHIDPAGAVASQSRGSRRGARSQRHRLHLAQLPGLGDQLQRNRLEVALAQLRENPDPIGHDKPPASRPILSYLHT